MSEEALAVAGHRAAHLHARAPVAARQLDGDLAEASADSGSPSTSRKWTTLRSASSVALAGSSARLSIQANVMSAAPAARSRVTVRPVGPLASVSSAGSGAHSGAPNSRSAASAAVALPHRQLEPALAPAHASASRARATARSRASRSARRPAAARARPAPRRRSTASRRAPSRARPGRAATTRSWPSRWVRLSTPRAISDELPSGATSHRRATTSARGRSASSSSTAVT